MNDHRTGDRYDEVHVGGHSASVHAGSNYNTYTINNYYYLYGADPRLSNAENLDDRTNERGEQPCLPAYLGHAAVQSGPNHSTNTYTITNNYYYYGGRYSPRRYPQPSEDGCRTQSRSCSPRLGSTISSRSLSQDPRSSATDHRETVESTSSDPGITRASYEVLQLSHGTDEVQSVSSTVELPVLTMSRARNAAFVGREALLKHTADHISEHTQAESPHGTTYFPDSGEVFPSHTPWQPPYTKVECLPALSSVDDLMAENSTKRSIPLADNLGPDHTESPTVCVLHGLGGVGKTQVALEFYYKHQNEYDAYFWVEAEDNRTLSSSFARIADKVEFFDKNGSDYKSDGTQEKAIEGSRNWLQQTGESTQYRRYSKTVRSIKGAHCDVYVPYL